MAMFCMPDSNNYCCVYEKIRTLSQRVCFELQLSPLPAFPFAQCDIASRHLVTISFAMIWACVFVGAAAFDTIITAKDRDKSHRCNSTHAKFWAYPY